MKRTGEIVLSVLGLIINAIVSLVALFIVVGMEDGRIQDTINTQFANNPDLSSTDPSTVIDVLNNIGWSVVIATVIGLIFGIIALFSLVGNKRPKLAGILLIIGAVIVLFGSVGAGFLPALLYLIAGIMSLARRPSKYSRT